jgi:hypothetical protein
MLDLEIDEVSTHMPVYKYFQKLEPTNLEIGEVIIDVYCQKEDIAHHRDSLNFRINSKKYKHRTYMKLLT